MSFTLNYEEPIPKVVKRLKYEHSELEPRLAKVQEEAKDGELRVAVSFLDSISPLLLRHAVEEEARLMRVIMWEYKDDSEASVSIMRYHREILAFLKHRLPVLLQMPDRVARREILVFVNDVRKHHKEEEKVVFPLALKADKLHDKRMESGRPTP